MKPCKELKRLSREILMGNYRIAMGAMITVYLIPLLIELPFSSLLNTEYATPLQRVVYYLAEFLIQLIAGMLQLGFIIMLMSMVRKKDFSHRQIYYCFKQKSDHYIAGFFIKLVLDLISMAPFLYAYYTLDNYKDPSQVIQLTVLGAISVVLIVIVNLVYGLSLYVLIDNEDQSVISCYKTARQMIKGHKGKLLYIYLSFIGLEILSLLSLGIGALWVEPYRHVTLINFYREISEPDNNSNPDPIYRSPYEQNSSFNASV